MQKLIICLCLSAISMACYAAEYNVLNFGAKADAKSDDTAAIQNALDEAAKVKGSKVYIPTGRYLINGTLYIPTDVEVYGDYTGFGKQDSTVLLSTKGKGEETGEGLIVMRSGNNILRNLVIEYPEQDAQQKEAIKYPFAIKVGAYSRVQNIFLLNPYQGLDLDGSHASVVRDVQGEPLRIGIHADHIYDICRIENIHFWPFFTNNKPLRTYVQQHGVAFQFGRSDWQYCFNTFCYGYKTGYRFFATDEVKHGESVYPAGTTNGNFVGIGADCVKYGIDIEDSFSIGISVINGEFAVFGGVDTIGVYLRNTNSGNITLTNCNFWAVADNLAVVESGTLNMVGCNVHSWNDAKRGATAFVISGGRVSVTSSVVNTNNGLFAKLSGDETRVTFSSIMGVDGLTIESDIAERLINLGNNPQIKVVSNKNKDINIDKNNSENSIMNNDKSADNTPVDDKKLDDNELKREPWKQYPNY
ncbi:MAG: glycosyl hydrolase family 28-related protein [Armatimonadota bacterium]